jgi:hypothetical protein
VAWGFTWVLLASLIQCFCAVTIIQSDDLTIVDEACAVDGLLEFARSSNERTDDTLTNQNTLRDDALKGLDIFLSRIQKLTRLLCFLCQKVICLSAREGKVMRA